MSRRSLGSGNVGRPTRHLVRISGIDKKDQKMNNSGQLPASIKNLAQSLLRLSQRAAQEYGQIVEQIIRSQCHDVPHIERTLDGLLDVCGYAPALEHYRRLCRYYYDIDPVAAASYVHAYREMWDSDFDVETEEQQ